MQLLGLEKERREARALKFGIQSSEMMDDKKKQRLERFKSDAAVEGAVGDGDKEAQK